MRIITNSLFIKATLIFVSCHVFAEGMIGRQDGSRFFPAPQAFKVVSAKFDDASKVQIDLRGVPTILRGSKIFFTENYFTIKNINSGGKTVIGSCFEQVGNMLIVNPAGRFSREGGKELILWKFDDHWVMPYGDNLKLHLKKISLPEDFDSTKRQFDIIYNLAIKKGYGQDRSCNLDTVEGIQLFSQSYQIIYEDISLSKTVGDGVLDPDSPVDFSYMSYAKKVSLNENIGIGNCQGKMLTYRYALGRNNRLTKEKGFFYLITALAGKTDATNKHCVKVKELKKVFMDSISSAYDVQEKYRDASFEFNRWEGEYGLVVRHKRTKRDFLISDINTTKIRISEIPFEENKK